jgi:hypothetical protein
LFARSAGIKLCHVPSRGANSALIDAAAGRMFGGSSVAFTDNLQVDNSRWSKVIKEAGLHQE